jgi:hypothetical protein
MTDEFELMGNDPGTWKTVAEALVYNAEVLKKHRYQQHGQGITASNISVYGYRTDAELLLWGYALEDFLKCLYLKEGGELARDDKYVGPKKHDLLQMARKAHLRPTSAQCKILKSLSIIIEWGGRYPIATTSQKTRESNYHWDDQQQVVLEELIEAIRLKIDAP